MILVFTNTITQRIAYAMNLVFKDVLGVNFVLTESINEYQQSSLPKFIYSAEVHSNELFLKQDGLMLENTVTKKTFDVKTKYLNIPIFFETDSSSFLPYDLFATIFYFASRYEEYISEDLDQHKRFKAENSIAYQHQILHLPFLNILIQDFADTLQRFYPSLNFIKRQYSFISTIDIDNAFAFANKGFKRNLGGFVKDLVKLNFSQIADRIKSNLNSSKDPYNTFHLINQLNTDAKTALQYFVLIGDYSDYDKNPHHENIGFVKLLQELSSSYSLGLHPSYQAYSEPNRIKVEKERLEKIINKKITSARCHFLRVNLPATYRAFIENGITDDYTMIYASQCGFRTGLCTPIKWFDLERNVSTNLTLHTSVVMEGILRDYNKINPVESGEKISELMNVVKQSGGEFISVWHNDSFIPKQKQWVDVYRKMLLNSKITK